MFTAEVLRHTSLACGYSPTDLIPSQPRPELKEGTPTEPVCLFNLRQARLHSKRLSLYPASRWHIGQTQPRTPGVRPLPSLPFPHFLCFIRHGAVVSVSQAAMNTFIPGYCRKQHVHCSKMHVHYEWLQVYHFN